MLGISTPRKYPLPDNELFGEGWRAVEDAGPYKCEFEATDKPKFENRHNEKNRLS